MSDLQLNVLYFASAFVQFKEHLTTNILSVFLLKCFVLLKSEIFNLKILKSFT